MVCELCFVVDILFLGLLLTEEAADDGNGKAEWSKSRAYWIPCHLKSATAHILLSVFIAEADIAPKSARASIEIMVW